MARCQPVLEARPSTHMYLKERRKAYVTLHHTEAGGGTRARLMTNWLTPGPYACRDATISGWFPVQPERQPEWQWQRSGLSQQLRRHAEPTAAANPVHTGSKLHPMSAHAPAPHLTTDCRGGVYTRQKACTVMDMAECGTMRVGTARCDGERCTCRAASKAAQQTASGKGDPYFTGFDQRVFELVGQPGTTYNLISERHHQACPASPLMSMQHSMRTKSVPRTDGRHSMNVMCTSSNTLGSLCDSGQLYIERASGQCLLGCMRH